MYCSLFRTGVQLNADDIADAKMPRRLALEVAVFVPGQPLWGQEDNSYYSSRLRAELA